VLHNASWKITGKLLLCTGINVDVVDVDGKTPFECYLLKLHLNNIKRTKRSRHFGIIKLYLQKFPWVINHKKPDGENLLHTIITWGNKDIFKEVLPYTSNIINDGDNDGFTPLHCACIKHQIEMLVLLLKNKMVDVNKQTNKGITALHYACYYRFNKIVAKLLAAPKIIKDVLDADNESPLHVVFREYTDELLGEERVLYFQNTLKVLDLMLDKRGEVYVRNVFGVTILDEAVALLCSFRSDQNADGITEQCINYMNQIVGLLQSCDGKRYKVYTYLRNVWVL
jgi:ankyrin repeat protein